MGGRGGHPRRLAMLASALLAPGLASGTDTGTADPGALYAEHCAQCHGEARLGGQGPALLPGNLRRLDREEAARVIAEGRAATQMPGFAGRLSPRAIDGLVDFIYSPPEETPQWGRKRIEASHRVLTPPGQLPSEPQFAGDPLNLFLVVEKADHHVTVLDGDRFEPIHRFATRRDLHGGPKYSPDGRFVYLASRDGWITKYDLYGLQKVATVRAGINTRNIALSADGQTLAVGNYLPHSLVLLDADDLTARHVVPIRGRGGESSRVSAVYTAPPRDTFVVALKDVTEVWEIPYGDLPQRREPSIRRIELEGYLDDFFFTPDYRYLVGSARDGGARVLDLDKGEAVASLPLSGMPHLGSGVSWLRDGQRVLATPNLRKGQVAVIDMGSWQVIERIETQGPGFFLRTHEASPYAWVDVFFGPERDAVHVIDKQSLEIVKTLRPEPGKTAAHVEFTRDGSHALLSIWAEDGALVVYDAETLEPVKRVPMAKPSGKYNVYNKTRYVTGTSH